MENKPNLSYLVVTRNKLPYLKIIMEKLLLHKKVDEEIIVADGASDDGTPRYLDQLKSAGRISDFTSESDTGFSHAMNKLILRARGTLFMLITDDDAYDYEAIEASKRFLLEHEEIDVVSTEGGVMYQHSQEAEYIIRPLNYLPDFRKWQKSRKPFSFAELGTMIRRSSLPIIGLRDTSIRRADAEFSLRLTSGKARIAWSNSYSYVNVLNKQSVSKVYLKELAKETDRLNKFYLDKNPDLFLIKKMKIIRNKLRMLLRRKKAGPSGQSSFPELIAQAEKWLTEKNRGIERQFFY